MIKINENLETEDIQVSMVKSYFDLLTLLNSKTAIAFAEGDYDMAFNLLKKIYREIHQLLLKKEKETITQIEDLINLLTNYIYTPVSSGSYSDTSESMVRRRIFIDTLEKLDMLLVDVQHKLNLLIPKQEKNTGGF